MKAAQGQVLTQLPDESNRLYLQEANKGAANTVATTTSKITDDKLENIFNVYASSINNTPPSAFSNIFCIFNFIF